MTFQKIGRKKIFRSMFAPLLEHCFPSRAFLSLQPTLHASALFIVIVIALVIGILCSSLMLIGYHYKSYVYDSTLLKRLESNAVSGINFMMAEKDQIGYSKDSVIDLFGEGRDSVLLKKLHWGLYEVGIVKSFTSGHALNKVFLYGFDPDTLTRSAIFLVDFSRPLSVSGATIINGDCFLPEAEIKRAYIEGKSFEGTDLVAGNIKRSGKSLPVLDTIMTENFLKFLKGTPPDKEDFELKEDPEEDTIRHSFFQKTLLLKYTGFLRLSSKVLSGNIIICSDTVVVVDSTAKLDNVLIFARGVRIENGFKGSIQVFAKDSITTGEYCEFVYPSSFGLFKIDFQTMQPFILVGKGTKITGILFSHQKVSDLQQTLITMEKETYLTGQVYADGYLDAKGTIYGNATCNKFLLKTASTIYENHLLDATIDLSRLSKHYTGSSIVSSSEHKRIIKFLE